MLPQILKPQAERAVSISTIYDADLFSEARSISDIYKILNAEAFGFCRSPPVRKGDTSKLSVTPLIPYGLQHSKQCAVDSERERIGRIAGCDDHFAFA